MAQRWSEMDPRDGSFYVNAEGELVPVPVEGIVAHGNHDQESHGNWARSNYEQHLTKIRERRNSWRSSGSPFDQAYTKAAKEYKPGDTPPTDEGKASGQGGTQEEIEKWATALAYWEVYYEHNPVLNEEDIKRLAESEGLHGPNDPWLEKNRPAGMTKAQEFGYVKSVQDAKDAWGAKEYQEEGEAIAAMDIPRTDFSDVPEDVLRDERFLRRVEDVRTRGLLRLGFTDIGADNDVIGAIEALDPPEERVPFQGDDTPGGPSDFIDLPEENLPFSNEYIQNATGRDKEEALLANTLTRFQAGSMYNQETYHNNYWGAQQALEAVMSGADEGLDLAMRALSGEFYGAFEGGGDYFDSSLGYEKQGQTGQGWESGYDKFLREGEKGKALEVPQWVIKRYGPDENNWPPSVVKQLDERGD